MKKWVTLGDHEQKQLLKYVSREPEFNLFIIGDIENFGICNETVNVYAHVVEDEWDCIVLRYLDNYIVYSQNPDYDAEAVAEFLSDKEVHIINGKEILLMPLILHMPDRSLRGTYLSKLTAIKPLNAGALDDGYELRRLLPSDAASVVDLYCLIDEFKENYVERKEKAIQGIELNLKQGGMGVGLFRGTELVSVAATSADNSQSAMVIGVATHPDCRKLGFASQVLTALCETSLSSGKEFLCLFYDNPEAGKIYQKLGFVEIGRYGMMKKNQ